MKPAAVLLALALACPLIPRAAMAEEIGRVGVDWVGNDIIIESVPDPKVQGVTCHLAYFDRSLIDRLSNGNWFEDPSYSAVDCVQTGAIILGDIDRDDDGETVFSERQSLILKSLRITRVYNESANALVYLAHANELTQGSGKMSISVIPLAAIN
jgi:CreA protein